MKYYFYFSVFMKFKLKKMRQQVKRNKRTSNKRSVFIVGEKKEPPVIGRSFERAEFTLPGNKLDEMERLDFFKIYWSNDMMQTLVENINNYSVQVFGSSINTSAPETQQLIGMQMMMCLICLPSYSMYWSQQTTIDPTAKIMSIKRYVLLRRYLHVVDNTIKNKESGKLFKVNPLLDALRNNCLIIGRSWISR